MSDLRNKPPRALAFPLVIATIALVATVCGVIAGGSHLPGKPNPADKPVPESDVLDLRVLYSTRCAGCHGPDGENGAAPPLADATFRTIIPEDVLKQVISAGRPGTPMPGFDHAHSGPLSAEQIQVLVYQIKGVSYDVVQAASGQFEIKPMKAGEGNVHPAWGQVSANSHAPPYLSRVKQRPSNSGADPTKLALYKRACAMCHGEHGEGSDAGAINDPDFLSLASDQMLRRIIITGRSDLGMPGFDDSDRRGSNYKPLTSDEIDEIVALFADWRQAGSAKSAAAHASLSPLRNRGRPAVSLSNRRER